MATPATAAESRRKPEVGQRFNPCDYFPQPEYEEMRAYSKKAFKLRKKIEDLITQYNEFVGPPQFFDAEEYLRLETVNGRVLRGDPKPVCTRKSKRKQDSRIAKLGFASGWICRYCNESGSASLGPDGRQWHVDHIYPRARGGDNRPDNLTLSCATCNLQKGAKLLSDAIAAKAAQ